MKIKEVRQQKDDEKNVWKKGRNLGRRADIAGLHQNEMGQRNF